MRWGWQFIRNLPERVERSPGYFLLHLLNFSLACTILYLVVHESGHALLTSLTGGRVLGINLGYDGGNVDMIGGNDYWIALGGNLTGALGGVAAFFIARAVRPAAVRLFLMILASYGLINSGAYFLIRGCFFHYGDYRGIDDGSAAMMAVLILSAVSCIAGIAVTAPLARAGAEAFAFVSRRAGAVTLAAGLTAIHFFLFVFLPWDSDEIGVYASALTLWAVLIVIIAWRVWPLERPVPENRRPARRAAACWGALLIILSFYFWQIPQPMYSLICAEDDALRELAAQGHPGINFWLGQATEFGYQTKADAVKAKRYYRRAYESGYPLAGIALAALAPDPAWRKDEAQRFSAYLRDFRLTSDHLPKALFVFAAQGDFAAARACLDRLLDAHRQCAGCDSKGALLFLRMAIDDYAGVSSAADQEQLRRERSAYGPWLQSRIAFAGGELDAPALLAQAERQTPSVRTEERRCEAYFQIAQRARQENRAEACASALQECLNTRQLESWEWQIAFSLLRSGRYAPAR